MPPSPLEPRKDPSAIAAEASAAAARVSRQISQMASPAEASAVAARAAHATSQTASPGPRKGGRKKARDSPSPKRRRKTDDYNGSKRQAANSREPDGKEVFALEDKQKAEEIGVALPPQAVSAWPRRDHRCYEVLGISRSASNEEVRRAYKRKALTAHPDKHVGGHSAFLSVAEAYETLSDRPTRHSYDNELVESGSTDGLSQEEAATLLTTGTKDDALRICRDLMAKPMAEWSMRIQNLPMAVLEQVRDQLDNPAVRPVLGCRGNGDVDSKLGSPPRGMHLFCMAGTFWCSQICIKGITIRSNWTKCFGTAADCHMALVTLKELLGQKLKSDSFKFDEALQRAVKQAGEQNMDVNGEDFSFFFHKSCRLGPGKTWTCRTPTVRDLETALKHRREVLALCEKGSAKKAIQNHITRLRGSEKQAQADWRDNRVKVEAKLSGYLMRAIEQRKERKSSTKPKRWRLHGKQSEACMSLRLPWFSKFAAETNISLPQLRLHLHALQGRLQPSLQLQGSVQNALAQLLEQSRMAEVSGSLAGPEASTGGALIGGDSAAEAGNQALALTDGTSLALTNQQREQDKERNQSAPFYSGQEVASSAHLAHGGLRHVDRAALHARLAAEAGGVEDAMGSVFEEANL